MLSALLTQDAPLRDALVNALWETKQHEENGMIFYQKQETIIAFSTKHTASDMLQYTLNEYHPERAFFILGGRSIDTEHEIWDIILPNVFLSYNPALQDILPTEENRDSLMGKAYFLEVFSEQKDYYVENFWLSLGGIVVDDVPEKADPAVLMTVYGADAYMSVSTESIRVSIENNILPALLIIGITDGKKSSYATHPLQFVAENILTTIRLLQENGGL